MLGKFDEVSITEQMEISGGDYKGMILDGWNAVVNGLLHWFKG